jgi:2-oxo-3-hexenedioate decarboxylase
LENNDIQKIANELHQARLQASPVKQYSDHLKEFNINDAYSVQEHGIELRKGDGETIIGLKMGLTSEAKRRQMDLDSPLYGVLTNTMQIENGGTFSLKGTIHPKIEPEVAFFVEKELTGKVTRDEVLESISWVCSAMEILDSRYEQFKYFSMEDVISDNSSSCMYVLGDKVTDYKDLNLSDLKMKMKVNGEIAHEGNSSAISGNPVLSVVQLCELLAERDLYLKGGQVVLAGAATAAVALENGMNIELEVAGLPGLSVKVTD